MNFGSRWLRFTGGGMPMQLTYVENCADAVLDVLETDATVGEVLNIIDDDLPTRSRYSRELVRRGAGKAIPIPVPGVVARAVARVSLWVGSLIFGGDVKLPWFASPPKLAVQLKALRFSNEKLRRLTGWTPKVDLDDALDRCFGSPAR